MAYADYTYYTEVYGGKKVSEEAFSGFAERASALIDGYTFGRISDDLFLTSPAIETKVKNACCSVCDDMQFVADGGGVSSESVDGYSISYANGVSKSKTEERRYYDTIRIFLANTGLLYRGN